MLGGVVWSGVECGVFVDDLSEGGGDLGTTKTLDDDAVAHAFVSLSKALGGWSGGATVGGGAAAR